MAVFMSGSTAGAGIALTFGGMAVAGAATIPAFAEALGFDRAWRYTFLLVGAPGLVLAAVMLAVVREPKRQPGTAHRGKPVGGVDHLWRGRQVYLPIFVGFACFSAAVYGTSAWVAEIFRREHGWDPHRFAMVAGPLQIAASVVGAFGTGWAIDRLQRTRRRLVALDVSVVLALALVPLLVLALLVTSATASLAGLCFAWLLMGSMLPAPGVVLQSAVAREHLAFATAVFLLAANLIGMGGGPTAVALASRHLLDHLSAGAALVAATTLLASAALLALAARRVGECASESLTEVPHEAHGQ
jgi:predicted MFS family arabinose efflux permease